jgi:hypothetical protein
MNWRVFRWVKEVNLEVIRRERNISRRGKIHRKDMDNQKGESNTLLEPDTDGLERR